MAPAGAPGVVRRSGALARRRCSFVSACCSRRDRHRGCSGRLGGQLRAAVPPFRSGDARARRVSASRRERSFVGPLERPVARAACHWPLHRHHDPPQPLAPGPGRGAAGRGRRIRAQQPPQRERMARPDRDSTETSVDKHPAVGPDDDGLPRRPGNAPGDVDTSRPPIELGVPDDRRRGRPRGSGRSERARGVGARGCTSRWR